MSTAIASHSRYGRPPKTEAERRTKAVQCWFTPAERAHLEASASQGSSLIDYARQIVLSDDALESPKPASKRMRSADDRLLEISLTFAEKIHLAELASSCGLSQRDYVRQALLHHSGFDVSKNVLEIKIPSRLACRLTTIASENGMTLPEFLLHQAQEEPQGKPSRSVSSSLLMKLDQSKQALDRIGNNVNQIAHALNAGRSLPGLSAIAGVELTQVLAKHSEVLEEVALHNEP